MFLFKNFTKNYLRYKSKKALVCAVFSVGLVLYAQDVTDHSKNNLEDTVEISDYDKKLDTLKYGLDEEVISLIEKLESINDKRFNTELAEMFESSKNIKTKQAILGFFASQSLDTLKPQIVDILSNFYDYDSQLVKACIKYSTDLGLTEVTAQIREIIKEDMIGYKDLCILAIGKIGEDEDAEFLVEYFDNISEADEKKALIMQQNIMLALIDLKAESTWDFLLFTAEDTDENSIIRARAAAALGKIGKPEAVDVLSKLYEDADPILREAAVKGMTNFSSAEADSVLEQAFKDSYYKVRLQAIKSARDTKKSSSIPFILYRAKTDPEEVVKFSAIDALAEIKDSKGLNWLKEKFLDKKTSEKLRVKIASSLLEYNFDFIFNDIKEITVESLSEKSKKRFAKHLGTSISKIENTKSASLAELFLNHSDPMIKSIGLDMYQTNYYPQLRPLVIELANNSKKSAIQRRAKVLLELNDTDSTSE